MFVSRTARRRTSLTLGTVGLAAGALTAGLITTASPASAATRTVTLTVNGVTTSVTTSADVVKELLTQQSVPFDSTDLVSPGLKADVYGGMAVSWTPAKRVLVRRAGETTAHRVVGNTVRDVRDELALPTATTQRFSRFEAHRYKMTRFYNVDGKRLTATDPVRENYRAVVHKVRVAFPDGQKRVERRVVKDRSKLVPSGSKRVYKEGRDGRKRVTYRKVLIDGDVHSKRIVKSRLIKDPKRKVVRIGTGPNWRALARCESGGNPNAVNPAGYYGLYQFSLSTWHAVGGRGNPTDFGYWEQTKRAWILFKGSGRSPWPYCGRFL